MKRLSILIALAFSLAACGGGGGAGSTDSSSLLPTAGVPAAPQATTTTSAIQTTGSIVALITGGFTLDTGYPHGKIHVYTSASTTFTGAKPYVGETVTVVGSGSWATSITATSVAQGTIAAAATVAPVASAAPVALPTNLVSLSGPISGMTATSITVATTTTHGHIPVTISASTAIVGGTLGVNKYVTVTGSGSLSGTVSGLIVGIWSSAPASTTVTGSVVGPTSYGLKLNVDATHPAVPIAVDVTTKLGGGVSTGAVVSVTGLGSTAEAITASSIATSSSAAATPAPTAAPTQAPVATPAPTAAPTTAPVSGSVPSHVITGDYLGGYWGTHNVSWAAAAPYLTWAQTSVADAPAIHAAGIKTMFYTDPFKVQSNDPMYTTTESAFAHDCSGNRITTTYNGIVQYVMNAESSSLTTLYHNVVSNQIGSAPFDALFADNTDLLGGTLPCGYTDSGWVSGMQSVFHGAARPVIYNGLSGFNGHGVSQTISISNDSNVVGGNLEHCYTDDSYAEYGGWIWSATENSEIQSAAKHKMFLCMERRTSSATSNYAARLFGYASFMLTYDPATSVLWEEFSTPSGFPVEPESKLVMLAPKVATPASVSGLLTSTGAYGREYGACYVWGSPVGPCAVVVNPDSVAHALPYSGYGHTLALSGSGVLDGGSLSTSGGAPSGTVPALSGEVLFR